MKLLIASILITTSLFAYQKDSTVSPEMLDTLKMQKNKLYIINFFASWCGSCKKELPLINKVYHQINTKKIKILGIDVDSKLKDGLAFQKKMGIRFPVINDNDNAIIKEFKALGMPSLYYIKNGKVLDVIIGAVHNIDQRLLADIKKYQ